MLAWHRLALELGGRTVDELKDAMTGIEFQDWLSYFELHPYGTEWEDVRMAVLSANICTALTGKSQDPKDHKAKYQKAVKKMTGKQIGMVMQSMVAEIKLHQKRA